MRLFVADIGNTRIKCGYYDGQTLRPLTTLDNPNVPSLEHWCESNSLIREDALRCSWLVAAVSPKMRDQFVSSLNGIGFRINLLDDHREVPINVDVQKPERVGIDRLLSALAIKVRFARGHPAAIISAGTAVTVDLIDDSGTFQGGVILPGFRLMARALHEYTAQLPLVQAFDLMGPVPAKSTELAIDAGICAAISGGIDRVVEQYRWQHPTLKAYLTGGDAHVLTTLACQPALVDHLVLIGLVLVAESRE